MFGCCADIRPDFHLEQAARRDDGLSLVERHADLLILARQMT